MYKTGLPCNPHTFRRTSASILAKRGVDLLHIQRLGRWESMAMVERYTKSDFKIVSGFILREWLNTSPLFNGNGQDKFPCSLVTAFPKSAIFHTYSSRALLESFRSPYFFASSFLDTLGFWVKIGYDTGLLILVNSAKTWVAGKPLLCSFWNISGLSRSMMGIALAKTGLIALDAPSGDQTAGRVSLIRL